MPLARYFSLIGGALLALLFILDACFPALPVAAKAKANLPVIRIYSDHKWPERTVYDTSLPTIVPTSIASTRSDRARAANDCRRSGRCESTRGLCDAANVCGRIARHPTPKCENQHPDTKSKIARKRPPASRVAMARHLQLGWFGGSFW